MAPRRGILSILLFPVTAVVGAFRGAGPILSREFVHHLRTAKVFRITLLTLAAGGLLPLLFWPRTGEPFAHFAAIGAFEIYRSTCFLSLLLFVPAISAAAISQEKEQGTYELLVMTHITLRQLLLGKLIAACAYFLILVTLTFPLACTLYLLGGFAVPDFVLSLLGMCILIPSLGLIGLTCSIRSRESSKAIFHAIVISLAFAAFAVPAGSVSAALVGSLSQAFLDYEIAVPTLGWLLGSTTYVFVAALFSIDLMVSLRSLKRFALQPANHVAKRYQQYHWARIAHGQVRVARTRRVQNTLEQAAGGIPDRWNPFYVLALKREVFGNAWLRRLAAGLVLLLCGFVTLVLVPIEFAGSLSNWLGYLTLVVSSLVLLAYTLLVPGPLAASIHSELLPDRLDLLRGTLLRPRELFLGKTRAALSVTVSALAVAAITCVLYALLGSLRGSIGPLCVTVTAAATWLAITALIVSTAWLAAVIARRGLQAQILSYALLLLWLLGTPGLASGFLGGGDLPILSACPFVPLFGTPLPREGSWGPDDALARWTLALGLTLLATLAVSAVQAFLALKVFGKRMQRQR